MNLTQPFLKICFSILVFLVLTACATIEEMEACTKFPADFGKDPEETLLVVVSAENYYKQFEQDMVKMAKKYYHGKMEVVEQYYFSKEPYSDSGKRRFYVSYEVEERTTPSGNVPVYQFFMTDRSTTFKFNVLYTAKHSFQVIEFHRLKAQGN